MNMVDASSAERVCTRWTVTCAPVLHVLHTDDLSASLRLSPNKVSRRTFQARFADSYATAPLGCSSNGLVWGPADEGIRSRRRLLFLFL